jgi:hypothetical protein
MYVGVADAARMHLHEHLIGSGLRLWNVFNLPRTADGGNDCSFHKEFDASAFAVDAGFWMTAAKRELLEM